ncbi:MAG: AAA family ATPase, partial [Deltaproteobacteria bacterium]|nr:AAA family ATPase [Deltaproteobacteria bacterium]
PPLVGRDSELTHLRHLFEQAIDGERQLVFFTGEPGIGKTALIENFLRGTRLWELGSRSSSPHPLEPSSQLPNPGCWVARGQCIEQFGEGEAYLPLLSAISQCCKVPGNESIIPELQQHAPTWLVQLPALVGHEEFERLQRKTAGATRTRMLRELAEALEVLTQQQPLILVLEDLHWSDPSTLEFLAFLARQRQPAKLLVLGTYRPVEMLADGHPLKRTLQELFAHHLATELALRLLTEADISTYLHRRFPASSLPTQLSQVLYQRTGGNPLFLTSLVRDLIARQVLTQFEGQWVLQGDLARVGTETPESIRHLIARQRERLLPNEQRLLEAASIAGTEFSAALVAAATDSTTLTIEEQCHRLTEQQQFLRPVGVSTWPDGTQAERYGFQHALYQQLWHERVSLTQRQQWHLRMGERLEVAYAQNPHAVAAELAQHFEQGRDYTKAIRYLQLAGEQAVRRSANQEATSYLTKGLELLQTLPDNPRRTRQELTLQLTLGAPLMNLKGWSAPDVERTYTRAQALCSQVGETEQLFPALWGIWVYYFIRAELRTARALGEHLLTLAQNARDPILLLEAHHAQWPALFFLGEWTANRVHLEQGIALYNTQQHSSLAFLYSGHDPGVCCQGYAAWTLWFLGYPDQGIKTLDETLALARESSYPSTIVDSLIASTWFYSCIRERRAAQEHAEAVIAICREQGFALNFALGTIVRGWALVEQGQGEEGIAQMREGLAAALATGAEVNRTYFLALLAGAYGTVGQPEEGLQVLAEALATVAKNDERFYEADIHRLKGELTLAGVRGRGLGAGKEEKQKSMKKRQKTKAHSNLQPLPEAVVEREAEEYFLKAIEIARQQQVKSLELRAVISLSRLWRSQGKRDQARRLLAELYNWFTEGFATADLQEAQALLTELS